MHKRWVLEKEQHRYLFLDDTCKAFEVSTNRRLVENQSYLCDVCNRYATEFSFQFTQHDSLVHNIVGISFFYYKQSFCNILIIILVCIFYYLRAQSHLWTYWESAACSPSFPVCISLFWCLYLHAHQHTRRLTSFALFPTEFWEKERLFTVYILSGLVWVRFFNSWLHWFRWTTLINYLAGSGSSCMSNAFNWCLIAWQIHSGM